MNHGPIKSVRDEDDEESASRSAKAKRVDIEAPIADVDIKLAEKLDNLLKISSNAKPKFLTNKTKSDHHKACNTTEANTVVRETIIYEKLKPRNLTKEELTERILKKYDTLVSENDPRRSKENVKFLSTSESIELGRDQARRQTERQLRLNSISGNQAASRDGLKGFKFNDGYEMPAKRFIGKVSQSKSLGDSILKNAQDEPSSSKSVTFAGENADTTEEEDEVDDSTGDDE